MQITSYSLFFLTNITVDCRGPAPGNKVCWQLKVMVNLCKWQEFPQCLLFCNFIGNSCTKAWIVIITAGGFSNAAAIQESFVVVTGVIIKV